MYIVQCYFEVNVLWFPSSFSYTMCNAVISIYIHIRMRIYTDITASELTEIVKTTTTTICIGFEDHTHDFNEFSVRRTTTKNGDTMVTILVWYNTERIVKIYIHIINDELAQNVRNFLSLNLKFYSHLFQFPINCVAYMLPSVCEWVFSHSLGRIFSSLCVSAWMELLSYMNNALPITMLPWNVTKQKQKSTV